MTNTWNELPGTWDEASLTWDQTETGFYFGENLTATVTAGVAGVLKDTLVTFSDGLNTYITEVRPGGSVLDSDFADNLDRGTESGGAGETSSTYYRVLQDTGYKFSNEQILTSTPALHTRIFRLVSVLVENFVGTATAGDGWVRAGALTESPAIIGQTGDDPAWTDRTPTAETWSNVTGATETWRNVAE
jgi:hypothetical protein